MPYWVRDRSYDISSQHIIEKTKETKKNPPNPKPKQTKQETPNKQTKQKTQKESENLASPEYLFSG